MRFIENAHVFLTVLPPEIQKRKEILLALQQPFFDQNFPLQAQTELNSRLHSNIVVGLGKIMNLIQDKPPKLPKAQIDYSFEHRLDMPLEDPRSVYYSLKQICETELSLCPWWDGDLAELIGEVKQVALNLQQEHSSTVSK